MYYIFPVKNHTFCYRKRAYFVKYCTIHLLVLTVSTFLFIIDLHFWKPNMDNSQGWMWVAKPAKHVNKPNAACTISCNLSEGDVCPAQSVHARDTVLRWGLINLK